MVVPSNRHQAVFDPERLSGVPVHIIGCGATGSRVAVGLAKLGIDTIIAYDYDKVEAVNLANQLFGVDDVGKKKVDALADMVLSLAGTRIHPVDRKVVSEAFSGYVFLLTDTASSRKEIFDNSIRYNTDVAAMFETRFSKEIMQSYVVDPSDAESIERWWNTLPQSDEVAAESACGTSVTVGPVADIVAGFVLWQFIRTANAITMRQDGVETHLDGGDTLGGYKSGEMPPWMLNFSVDPVNFIWA